MAAWEQNKNEKSCEYIRQHQENKKIPCEIKQCSEKRQKTKHCAKQRNQLKRLGRLAAHTIHGKPDQSRQTEFTAAAFTFGSIIGDADLLVPELSNCSSDVRRVISDFSEVLNDGSIDQSKVAGIDR
jgi:hypothetical protein